MKIVAASYTHSVRQNVTVDDAFGVEIYCNFLLLLLLFQKIKLTILAKLHGRRLKGALQ